MTVCKVINDEKIQIEKRYHNAVSAKTSDVIYGLPIPPFVAGHVEEILGDLNGKTVVEIGCGRGENLVKFALKGANVFGGDISENMVSCCRELIEQNQLSGKAKASVMNAEAMEYPDNFADVIIGNAILHHLDLPAVSNEIYRCLKSDGVAVFSEPLGHNPLINLFRKITPNRRTPTEKPLKLQDLKVFSEKFNIIHTEFYFFALLAIPLGMLGLKSLCRRAFTWLHKFDRIFADSFLRRYFWISVIQLRKKQS
jgi:SAM-dependent methyltransferase